MSKKYRIPCPTNIQLLKAYHELLKNKRVKKSNKIERLLITRPIRSLSGIANVSVLTKPYPCPGKCLYCPTEKGIPKSYLSGEPAVERAKKLNYDPYLQVQKRIEMLEAQGHPTDKIELRIIGGTWSFYDKKYQFWFIKRCFDACNGKKSSSLETGQKINETEKHRIIGLSIETRPDFIDGKEIIQMRELGITKVELGVQSIYNNILELNKRGHSIDATIKATKLLKDAGFKVSYQMMPNLPGSNPKKDVKMFKELFENSDFKPDLIKIYPCALVKEASLYKWYLKGKYKPYSEKKLITIIKEIKNKIPYYVRIERIIRDIPAQKIIAGPTKISNLREAILEEMKKEGRKCKCIRCREIRENYNPKERLYLFRENYEASGGKEIFLSFENKNRMRLYSLLRLRIPSYIYSPNNASIPTLRNSSIIREIHTYGQLIPIATKEMAAQHRGLGKKLVRKAEKITTREFNLNKIAVISAVGTRDYYRKLGYKLKDTYMIKKL
jgi:elongator complex protein 3